MHTYVYVSVCQCVCFHDRMCKWKCIRLLTKLYWNHMLRHTHTRTHTTVRQRRTDFQTDKYFRTPKTLVVQVGQSGGNYFFVCDTKVVGLSDCCMKTQSWCSPSGEINERRATNSPSPGCGTHHLTTVNQTGRTDSASSAQLQDKWSDLHPDG